MNAKRKWYDSLLPCLAALLVLAAVAVQTANAKPPEYVQGGPYYDDDTYESEEGPGETVMTVSDSNPEGECLAYARIICDANGVEGPENASAYGGAWASWIIDWEWNGPPGDAPGGTLTWSQDGEGNAYAYGSNLIEEGSDGSAFAAGDAYADTGSEGTEGSAWGYGSCWGSVEDHHCGQGNYDGDGDPEEDYDLVDEERSLSIAYYSTGIEWEFISGDDEDIPSGTTYVYFAGGVGCDTQSSANAYEEATSSSDSDSQASTVFGADFSSN